MGSLIRFDWAIKRILRNKADYCIVEGLLTVLLGKQIRIKSLLESEGNKESSDDKFNRADLLAEDDSGALMIFETPLPAFRLMSLINDTVGFVFNNVEFAGFTCRKM